MKEFIVRFKTKGGKQYVIVLNADDYTAAVIEAKRLLLASGVPKPLFFKCELSEPLEPVDDSEDMEEWEW